MLNASGAVISCGHPEKQPSTLGIMPTSRKRPAAASNLVQAASPNARIIWLSGPGTVLPSTMLPLPWLHFFSSRLLWGVEGLESLLAAARIPADVVAPLQAQVAALGAVHVGELLAPDWERLPAWEGMRELERRRILHRI